VTTGQAAPFNIITALTQLPTYQGLTGTVFNRLALATNLAISFGKGVVLYESS